MTKIVLTTVFIAILWPGIIPARAQSTRLDTASLRHLPPDASQVIRINLPYLLTKVNWSELSPIIAGFCPQIPSGSLYIDSITNPKNIGLNVRKPALVATGFNPDHSGYTSIILSLSDSGSFVSWFRKAFPFFHPKTMDGIRTANTNHANLVWNDHMAVISIGDNYRYTEMLSGYDASRFIVDTAFVTAFSGNTDIQIWATDGFGLPASAQTTRKSGEPHIIVTFQFQTGRMILTAQGQLTTLGTSRVHLFTNRPLPEQWLAPFPKDELLGFASLHVDTAGMSFIVDSNFAGSMLLSLINGQSRNITRALRGDVLVAAVRSNHPGDLPQGKINFYTIATIKDSVAMAKLASSLGLSYAVHDTICVIANSAGAAKQYFNAPPNGPSPLVSDALRSYPFGGAIDLKALRVTYPVEAPAGIASGLLTTLLQLTSFNRLGFTIGYTPHTSVTQIELDCLDPGANSLIALLKDTKK